jgi:hypothetical protein
MILTTAHILTCPHSGKFQIAAPNSFLKIGSGSIVLDEDKGIATSPCPLGICVSFTAKSMKLNSLKWNGRHIMLVTDTILSDSGFPILVAPPLSLIPVVDDTAPEALLNSNQPLPGFLKDFDLPTLKEAAPSSPPVWPDTDYSITINLECGYPGEVAAMLFSVTKLSDGNNLLHNRREPTFQMTAVGGSSSSHTILVNIPKKMRDDSPVGEHRLMVRVASQRGMSGLFEKVINKTSS